MSEDISEKTASAEETISSHESSVESKEDVSSELDPESLREGIEPEMTTEEVASTLSEEATEEAATTLEGNTEKTEPATTKEKETAKLTSGQNPTPGATTTSATPETMKATAPAPTTTAAPQPTTTAAPTQPAHTHNYKGAVTKAATCGAAGVMTYTCSCGKNYTEAIPATGNHNWVEQTKTVHHDAQTHIVHHDAVTHIVHHDEVSHQEWVVDRPAYDENVTEAHSFCNGCGKDLTVLEWETGTTPAEHSLWHIEQDGIGYGWHTEQVVIDVIHHEEVGHYKTVVDQPAWDETVVDQPAWDETVIDKEAWEETVHDCYKCSVCGATKP